MSKAEMFGISESLPHHQSRRMMEQSKLRSRLVRLKRDAMLTDVVVTCHGTSFPIHKCIVSASSYFFKLLFTGQHATIVPNEFDMSNFCSSAELLNITLEFAYTGLIDLDMDNIAAVVDFAHFLSMEDLLEECATYFNEVLNKDTCLGLYLALYRLETARHGDETSEPEMRLTQVAWDMLESCFYDHVIMQDEILRMSTADILHLLSRGIVKHFSIERVLEFLCRWLDYRSGVDKFEIVEMFINLAYERQQLDSGHTEPVNRIKMDALFNNLEDLLKVDLTQPGGDVVVDAKANILAWLFDLKLDMYKADDEQNKSGRAKDGLEADLSDDPKEDGDAVTEVDLDGDAKGDDGAVTVSELDGDVKGDICAVAVEMVDEGPAGLESKLEGDAKEDGGAEMESELVRDVKGEIGPVLLQSELGGDVKGDGGAVTMEMVDDGQDAVVGKIEASDVHDEVQDTGTGVGGSAGVMDGKCSGTGNVDFVNKTVVDEPVEGAAVLQTQVNLKAEVDTDVPVDPVKDYIITRADTGVVKMDVDSDVDDTADVLDDLAVEEEMTELDTSHRYRVDEHVTATRHVKWLRPCGEETNKEASEMTVLKDRNQGLHGVEETDKEASEMDVLKDRNEGLYEMDETNKEASVMTVIKDHNQGLHAMEETNQEASEMVVLNDHNEGLYGTEETNQEASEMDALKDHNEGLHGMKLKAIEQIIEERIKECLESQNLFIINAPVMQEIPNQSTTGKRKQQEPKRKRGRPPGKRVKLEDVGGSSASGVVVGGGVVKGVNSGGNPVGTVGNGGTVRASGAVAIRGVNSGGGNRVGIVGNRVGTVGGTSTVKGVNGSSCGNRVAVGDVNAASTSGSASAQTRNNKTQLKVKITKRPAKVSVKKEMEEETDEEGQDRLLMANLYTTDYIAGKERKQPKRGASLIINDYEEYNESDNDIDDKDDDDYEGVQVDAAQKEEWTSPDYINSMKRDDGKFECSLCDQVLKTQKSMKNHMNSHAGVKPHRCFVCGMVFGRSHHLQRHTLRKHSEAGVYGCDECDREFDSAKDLNTHARIHMDLPEGRTEDKHIQIIDKDKNGKKTFKCGVCLKTFVRQSHLRTHVRIHTGAKPFKCLTCTMPFRRKSDLVRHVNWVHAGQRPMFKCEFCKKFFTTKEGQEKHMAECKRGFKCDVCGAFFYRQYHLERHRVVHDMARSHQCRECGRRFQKESQLKVHAKTHGAGTPTLTPQVCDVCGAVLKDKKYLKRHMDGHLGVRYECTICKKSYSQQAGLQVHMRMHTGAKPYQCEICSMLFAVKSNLMRHQRRHRGDKKHKCDQCGKGFIMRGDLRRHYTMHTGEKNYQCKFCGKKFSSKSKLPQHERIHTGEKPYECAICGKRFIQSCDKKRHEATHGLSVPPAPKRVSLYEMANGVTEEEVKEMEAGVKEMEKGVKEMVSSALSVVMNPGEKETKRDGETQDVKPLDKTAQDVTPSGKSMKNVKMHNISNVAMEEMVEKEVGVVRERQEMPLHVSQGSGPLYIQETAQSHMNGGRGDMSQGTGPLYIQETAPSNNRHPGQGNVSQGEMTRGDPRYMYSESEYIHNL